MGHPVLGRRAVDGHHLLHQGLVQEAAAAGPDAAVEQVVPEPLQDVRRVGEYPDTPAGKMLK